MKWLVIILVLFTSGCKAPPEKVKTFYIVDIKSGDITFSSHYVDGTLFSSQAIVSWYDESGNYHEKSIGTDLAVKEK